MKKIITLFSIAAIAFAAVSCDKEVTINIENTTHNERVIDFSTEPLTKTVFGTLDGSTYPTLWTTNKNVALSLNYATARESTTPVLVSGGTSANFSAALVDDDAGTKKILAVSPFTAIVSTGSFNEEYKSIKFKIETDQVPLANSVDEDNQVLASFNNAGSSLPESVTMSFNHVAAYGVMSFLNLGLAGDETVASVSMTSTLDWAGQFYYYFEDNTHGNNAGDITVSSGEKTINLTTTSTSDIWFACAPVAIGGTTVHVVITTNKGTTYSKDVAFPAGKAFQSGKVAKFAIDMDGILADGATVYTLVTNVADLTLGSEILIVSNSTDHAAGALGSNTYLTAYSITKSGSNINTPSASVEVFKIANGNIAGTYALQCSSDGDKYLTWSTGTTLSKNASLTDNGSWSIAITGAGVATIRSMGDPTRYILSNTNSSNRFSTYNGGTGYNNVSIYKDASTGSGAITAKTVTGIQVNGGTRYVEKDASYSFDGTVEAVYSDLSTGAIATGYTVDDSAVNTATTGTYSVSVSYDSNPSINTSFSVVVYPAGSVVYAPYSGELVEGDYVVVGSTTTNAMKNTVSSNRLQYETITLTDGAIYSPAVSVIWHIAKNGDYWTFYSANVSKYAAGKANTNNQAALVDSVTDYTKWSFTETSGVYEFVNYGRANDPSNNVNIYLRNNGTSGFACYGSGTGNKIALYKKL